MEPILNMQTMKKNLVFLLAVCLFFQTTKSQDLFTVIKVSGNIIIERTGSSLGIGTSFAQTENLLFKIPESRAAVINPERGRFLLTAENLTEFKNSRTNYLPSAGKISTRNLNVVKIISDLKDHFEGSYLLFNELALKIDTAENPMRENRFFYITYSYQNRTINKKLIFNYDTLFLTKNELLAVDGKIISDSLIKEMKLMYLVSGDSYTSYPVCVFKPVFPDYLVLGQEIALILDQLNKKSYNDIYSEISSFIREFYGKVDDANLSRWLSENFGLKDK